MGVPVLPLKDPLTQGESVSTSYYLPEALKKEVERQARIDGYERSSPYVVELLVWAIRERERERLAEDKAKHQSR